MNEWELLPTRAGVALSLRKVRTKAHKLTVDYQSGAGEVYDLVTDPDEMSNLFDAPEAEAMKAELNAMLATRPGDMREIQTQVGMA